MTKKTTHRDSSRNYRVFVLGAGFSSPAGLPLTADLFGQILSKAKSMGLYAPLKNDIYDFLEYLERMRGIKVSEEQINFEEFMSFLDVDNNCDSGFSPGLFLLTRSS